MIEQGAHGRHAHTTELRSRPRCTRGGVGCRSFLCQDIRFYVTTGKGLSKGFAIVTKFGHRKGDLVTTGPWVRRDRGCYDRVWARGNRALGAMLRHDRGGLDRVTRPRHAATVL